ncbi:MAG: four helix bundle protein [bacterium]
MAYYSHLPIYNTAFSLLKDLYERVPKFGKQYKYLLGGEIIKASIESIRIIISVNNSRNGIERRKLLEELLWQSESIIILLRIANELKQLGGERSYLYLTEKSVALSKQAEGWRKSVVDK